MSFGNVFLDKFLVPSRTIHFLSAHATKGAIVIFGLFAVKILGALPAFERSTAGRDRLIPLSDWLHANRAVLLEFSCLWVRLVVFRKQLRATSLLEQSRLLAFEFTDFPPQTAIRCPFWTFILIGHDVVYRPSIGGKLLPDELATGASLTSAARIVGGHRTFLELPLKAGLCRVQFFCYFSQKCIEVFNLLSAHLYEEVDSLIYLRCNVS